MSRSGPGATSTTFWADVKPSGEAALADDSREHPEVSGPCSAWAECNLRAGACGFVITVVAVVGLAVGLILRNAGSGGSAGSTSFAFALALGTSTPPASFGKGTAGGLVLGGVVQSTVAIGQGFSTSVVALGAASAPASPAATVLVFFTATSVNASVSAALAAATAAGNASIALSIFQALQLLGASLNVTSVVFLSVGVAATGPSSAGPSPSPSSNCTSRSFSGACISNGPVDIGVFVAGRAAGAEPGAAWLMSADLPDLASAPSRDSVAAVLASCRASRPMGARTALLPLLPARAAADVIVGVESRLALIKLVDAAWSAASLEGCNATQEPPPGSGPMAISVWASSSKDDFKLVLSLDALRDTTSKEVVAALVGAIACEPDTIAVRRTTATGRWISFHCDLAARTLQVPLLDDAACTGGRLVFGREGGELELVERRAGVPLVHGGDEAHGVTALTAGVRYGLLLICS